METPLGYRTKSERRHYERQAKRMERFLRKLFRVLDRGWFGKLIEGSNES